tara:strand:+ start:10561 stop:11562 length:1002 start_codon:yes stop_codon:yes gene_type:complete
MTSILDKINENKGLQDFVSTTNVEMLWHIIIQNKSFSESVQQQTAQDIGSLRPYFISFMQTFVAKNINNIVVPLIDLNKTFIAEFIHSFKEDSPHRPARLDLSDNTPIEKNVITIEELKNERLNKFENEYEEMQNDFNMYRQSDAPSDVTFKDETKEETPLNNEIIQDVISEKIQSRTDEESGFLNNATMDDETVRSWLNLNNTSAQESPKSINKNVSFSVEETAIENKVVSPLMQFEDIETVPIIPISPSSSNTNLHNFESPRENSKYDDQIHILEMKLKLIEDQMTSFSNDMKLLMGQVTTLVNQKKETTKDSDTSTNNTTDNIDSGENSA